MSETETAVILAGAVAKGAFEAGVLQVLAQQPLGIRRLVSASVGSLNALVYAAGMRAGTQAQTADGLIDLWRTRAQWSHVFELSPVELWHRRALSGTEKVAQLLTEELARWLGPPGPRPPSSRAPVELRMVVTLTDGVVEKLGPDQATTYEHVFVFRDDDFDDADKRKQMVDVAVASAAFPVAFAPKELAGFGLGYDGGLVANTPVKEAIVGSGIERIFVIDPQPAQVAAGGLLHGTELLSHLGDILVRERLFRDLSDAYECNDALARLTGLVATGALTAEQHATVLATLGWQERRILQIVPVRATAPLPGTPFSGFFDGALREQYIAAGQEAGTIALHGIAGLSGP